MEKKLWYAIQVDDDNDWSDGTFNLNDALQRCKESNEFLDVEIGERPARIAVIDANYDEDGYPTTDGECIDILDEDGFKW